MLDQPRVQGDGNRFWECGRWRPAPRERPDKKAGSLHPAWCAGPAVCEHGAPTVRLRQAESLSLSLH